LLREKEAARKAYSAKQSNISTPQVRVEPGVEALIEGTVVARHTKLESAPREIGSGIHRRSISDKVSAQETHMETTPEARNNFT